jgi:hypothetical protein
MYQGDMIVICRTFQEYLLNLWKVFQQFLEACLKLNTGSANTFRRKYGIFDISNHLRG